MLIYEKVLQNKSIQKMASGSLEFGHQSGYLCGILRTALHLAIQLKERGIVGT